LGRFPGSDGAGRAPDLGRFVAVERSVLPDVAALAASDRLPPTIVRCEAGEEPVRLRFNSERSREPVRAPASVRPPLSDAAVAASDEILAAAEERDVPVVFVKLPLRLADSPERSPEPWRGPPR
jgi:hypothetical protein